MQRHEAAVEILWQHVALFVDHLNEGFDLDIRKIAILRIDQREHFSSVRRHADDGLGAALVQEGGDALGVNAEGIFKTELVQERAAVDLVLAIVADVVAEGFQDSGGLFIDRKEAFFVLGKDRREHFFRRHAALVHEVAHAHHPAENRRAGINDP